MSGVFTRLILVLIFVLSKPVLASENFQYWSWFTLNTLNVSGFIFSTFAEMRFDENRVSEPKMYLISEKVKFSPFKHLSLGSNFTYLGIRKLNDLDRSRFFKHQFRVELEINTNWQVKGLAKIRTRNRMEFRLFDNTWYSHTRFRQRTEFEIPLQKNRYLKSLFFNNDKLLSYTPPPI